MGSHTKAALLIGAAGIALMAAPSSAQVAADAQAGDTKVDTQAAEEITITGVRASLQKSQQQKKNADSVVEVLTFEDLGKFSDNSVVDSLQRVPGVQIERDDDQISGDRVSIRGLGPSFTAVTVNGRILPSSGSEGIGNLRSFNLDAYPSEILSGATVYKTPTAQLNEVGLAGAVDLKTLRPLDFKSQFGHSYFGSFTVRSDTDDQVNLANRYSLRLSGVVGVKLLDNTLGIYVAGIHSKVPNGSNELFAKFDNRDLSFDDNGDGKVDRVVPGVLYPRQVTMSKTFSTSKRDSLTGGIQYRPTSNLEFNVDYLRTRLDAPQNRSYTDMTFTNVFNGVSGPGGFTVQNGQVTAFDTSKVNYTGVKGGVFTAPVALRLDQLSTTSLLGFNGAWHNDGWKVSADYSHGTLGFREVLGIPIPFVDAPNNPGRVVWDGTGRGLPVVTGVTNVSYPAGTPYPGYFAREYRNNQRQDAGQFDVERDLTDSFTVKVGARYTKARVQVTEHELFTVSGADNPYGFTDAKASQIGDIVNNGASAGIFENFGSQWTTLDPRSDYTAAAALIPALRDYAFPGDPNPAFSYIVKEQTLAFYGQIDGRGEILGMPARGNLGLRAVQTRENASASISETVRDSRTPKIISTSTLPVSDTHRYWTYLPSLNVDLEPARNLAWRIGVSKAMSRPEFEQLAPINSTTLIQPDPTNPLYDPNAPADAKAGNTKLKPMTAWQFDMTLEYYTPNKGAFYASIFYKDVKNFVLDQTLSRVTLPGYGSKLFNAVEPVNYSDGKVKGFELGLDQPLSFLPGPFDALGVQANYTYVDSKFDKQNSALSFGFPGASKNNFNVVAYYERPTYAFRAAYVYRSNYFVNLGGGNDRTGTPQFTQGNSQLNASVSFKPDPHLELTLSGVNLTKENRRDFVVYPSMFRSFLERSRTFSFSGRVVF